MTAEKDTKDMQRDDGLVSYFSERRRVHSATFSDTGLLKQAIALLKAKLQADPANAKLLGRLADACRAEGNLAEAADFYSQLFELEPDNRKAELAARLLAQQSAQVTGPCDLVPFTLSHDALGALRGDIFHDLLTYEQQFDQAGVINPDLSSTVNEYWRSAFILRSRHWGGWKAGLKERLRQILVDAGPQFGVATSPTDRLECQITAHTHNGYYDAHVDTNPNPDFPAHTRKLTYIIYMNSVPKQFSGGDLLLYDFQDRRDPDNPAPFTRIIPQDGLMVIFPSQDALHEVSIVDQPTGKWADARFTINGWLHQGSGADLI